MNWHDILKINLQDTYIYAAINAGDVELSTDPAALKKQGWKVVGNRWTLLDIMEWTEEILEEEDGPINTESFRMEHGMGEFAEGHTGDYSDGPRDFSQY